MCQEGWHERWRRLPQQQRDGGRERRPGRHRRLRQVNRRQPVAHVAKVRRRGRISRCQTRSEQHSKQPAALAAAAQSTTPLQSDANASHCQSSFKFSTEPAAAAATASFAAAAADASDALSAAAAASANESDELAQYDRRFKQPVQPEPLNVD